MRRTRYLASSAGVVAIVVPLWISLWVVVFLVGVAYHRVETMVPWIGVMVFIWMTIPIIGGGAGIYCAIQAARYGDRIMLPIVAGIANGLWLLVGLIPWLLMALGVSA